MIHWNTPRWSATAVILCAYRIYILLSIRNTNSHSLRSWRCLDDWFGCREWDQRGHVTRTNSSQKWLWIRREILRQVETGHTHLSKKKKPVIHYPVFISTKNRKQSQVSLFSKWIPISILFITFALCNFFLCLPRQWRQKCLLAPTNITTEWQRWRPQTPRGWQVFHEPRINPQAHGILM